MTEANGEDDEKGRRPRQIAFSPYISKPRNSSRKNNTNQNSKRRFIDLTASIS